MQNPGSSFEHVVFLFGAQGKSSGGHGSGAVEFPVIQIYVTESDVNVSVAAVVVVAVINFAGLRQMFEGFFAKAGEMLPGRQLAKRCGCCSSRPFFSGPGGFHIDLVAQLERKEPLHEGDIYVRAGKVAVVRIALAILVDGLREPGQRLIVVALTTGNSTVG